MPGQFFAVHSIATDFQGEHLHDETYDGRRLQKFTYKGMQTVTKGEDPRDRLAAYVDSLTLAGNG